MAAQQASQGEVEPLERAMLRERLDRILRAGGSEAAGGRGEWRHVALVAAYGRYEQERQQTAERGEEHGCEAVRGGGESRGKAQTPV